MTAPDVDSIAHLEDHHGDFKHFANLMVKTHAGRFGGTFWAFVEQHTSLVDKGGVVVDLGTGPGLLLRDLTTRYENTRAVGIEVQPEMLKLAKDVVAEDADRRQLIEADVSQPPLAVDDNSADVVIASVLLHELPVPTRMIDEALRILKPGGTFIMLDWIRQPLSTYCDGERPDTLSQFTHFSEHCRYTADDLEWLFQQSGFVVDDFMLRSRGRFILMAASKPG